jgi:stage III sporulation protein AF
MIEFLKGWVLNIVILTMFIVLLEILIPSGKIKKFIDLVSGLILIIAVINPFVGLLGKDLDLKELQISSSNFIDRKEIEANSKVLNEQHIKQITEVYRKKIIKQLEDNTKEIKGVADAKADVLIDQNYESPSFGEIKRVYLDLKLGDKEKGVKPVLRVDKVELGTKGTISEDGGEINREIKQAIETKITRTLGIQNEDIIISLQDG